MYAAGAGLGGPKVGSNMGLFSAIGAGIGAVTNLVGGHYNRKAQRDINRRNIAFQREVNEQQMQFQKNAVSIRAKDMERAGLSKTLAAGNAASAPTLGTPQLNAPRYDELSRVDPVGKYMGLRAQSAAIDKTESETEAIELQNQFAGQTLKDRILRESLNNSLLVDRQEINQLDKQIKRYMMTQEEYKALAAPYIPDTARAQLSKVQQEALEKQMAIKIMDHNLAYARSKKLPVGAQPTKWTKLFSEVQALLNDLMARNGFEPNPVQKRLERSEARMERSNRMVDPDYRAQMYGRKRNYVPFSERR